MRQLKPRLWHALWLVWLALLPGLGSAQTQGPDPQAIVFSQEDLDQLMAPVALYPDTLLMQVLVASTYPLEIVQAERLVRTNTGLKGDALAKAGGDKGWDASVVSLLQFPSVITMMNDKLDWTQKLGDAFLAQQSDVMDTVQALRARAQQAGNLQDSSQQKVVVQEKIIVIEPAQPQVVYVPYYNPVVVYGPWWAPARPPWFWMPPPIYRPPSFGQVVAAGIFWGVAIGIRNEIWNDYRPNWRDRQVNIINNVNIINVNNRPRPGSTWQHNPVHRKGVAYRDNAVRDRVTAGSAIRPPERPQARPGAIERLPSRGDDDTLKLRPSARPATRPEARPGVGIGAPSEARPGARPALRPEARPEARPQPLPTARPEARPQTRPVPGLAARPSPIRPDASREVIRANADRGRASREAAVRPAPRPRPAAAPGNAGRTGMGRQPAQR